MSESDLWHAHRGPGRAQLLEHLALAERHVAQGAEHSSRQRELIADLEQGGHDTTRARALLHEFEKLQVLHLSELERVRGELERTV